MGSDNARADGENNLRESKRLVILFIPILRL